MASRWPLSGLLLLILSYRGGGQVISVTQTPPLQAALAHENVSISCTVHVQQNFSPLEVGIYKVNAAGQETLVMRHQHSPENKNLTLSTDTFRFQPVKDPHTAGSYYYCVATTPVLSSTRFRGKGTFTHIRDTGFVRSTVVQWKGLHALLSTTCSLLAILSLVGTGLLLLWSKKGCPTWSSVRAPRADGGRKGDVSGGPSGAEVCPPASIYTTLGTHTAEVYDTIEQQVKVQPSASGQSGPPQHSPQQPQAKSPNVQDGGKTTSSELPSTPKHKPLVKKKSPEVLAVGKTRTSDKRPQQAAAQEEILETVYENLKGTKDRGRFVPSAHGLNATSVGKKGHVPFPTCLLQEDTVNKTSEDGTRL